MSNQFIKDDLHIYHDIFDSDDNKSYTTDDDKSDIDIPAPQIEYKSVTHNIIINSLDRDWTGTDDTPFNFRIKFSPSSESRTSYPLYQNSPTIPATIQQASNGNRGDANLSGWYDNNNNFQLGYDPTQPPGNIVQYEEITIREKQYVPISSSYKNVISINLTGAILPNQLRRVEYTTQTEYLSNFQYLNIVIDEIQNKQEGSSTQLRKSFAILYPKLLNLGSAPTKFMEYSNVNRSVSLVNLNTLPMMTINCFDPANKLLSDVADVIDIEYIYYQHSDVSDSQTERLAIKTTTYFDSRNFEVGDRIRVKDYAYADSTSVYGKSFNDFINREEGHTILETDVSVSGKYLKNIIYIPKPASLDKITGDITDETWYTLLKIDDFPDANDTIYYNETGKLVNVNMQTTFFFQITTLEPEVKQLQPINVSMLPSNRLGSRRGFPE